LIIIQTNSCLKLLIFNISKEVFLFEQRKSKLWTSKPCFLPDGMKGKYLTYTALIRSGLENRMLENTIELTSLNSDNKGGGKS